MPPGKTAWSLFSALRGLRSGAVRQQGAQELREAGAGRAVFGSAAPTASVTGLILVPTVAGEERRRLARLASYPWRRPGAARSRPGSHGLFLPGLRKA